MGEASRLGVEFRLRLAAHRRHDQNTRTYSTRTYSKVDSKRVFCHTVMQNHTASCASEVTVITSAER